MPLDNDARRRAAETKRKRARQAIKDAAFEVMSSDVPLTFDAVAERAGLSVATVYRYYPTMRDLRWSIVPTLAEGEDRDPKAEVRALMQQLFSLLGYMMTSDEVDQWRDRFWLELEDGGLPREVVAELVLDSLLNWRKDREPIQRVSTEGLEFDDHGFPAERDQADRG